MVAAAVEMSREPGNDVTSLTSVVNNMVDLQQHLAQSGLQMAGDTVSALGVDPGPSNLGLNHEQVEGLGATGDMVVGDLLHGVCSSHTA